MDPAHPRDPVRATAARRREVPTVDLEWDVEVADPAPNPEERTLAVESTDRTARGLNSLSSQHRDVISLFYYGGMALRGIAVFLDIPVHTVKNRLFAARKQLKEMIVMVKNDSEDQLGHADTLDRGRARDVVADQRPVRRGRVPHA